MTPRFGQMPLKKITRDDVKNLASTISEKGDRSRNTVRWILTALRAVLSSAMEDKLIDNNPASKIGKFNKRERGVNKAQAMTMGEAEAFLNACVEICPDYYPLFFTALRSASQERTHCASVGRHSIWGVKRRQEPFHSGAASLLHGAFRHVQDP